jgi:hypothetical protein
VLLPLPLLLALAADGAAWEVPSCPGADDGATRNADGEARRPAKSVRASVDGSSGLDGGAGQLRRSVSNLSGVSKRAFKF